jgi:hypothetical protein
LRILKKNSLRRFPGNLTVRLETEGTLMRKSARKSPSRKTIAAKKPVQRTSTVLSAKNTVAIPNPTILGNVLRRRMMGPKKRFQEKK